MSRSLPEAFRDCHVQRLGGFFRAHRDGLMALAPPDRRDHPRVVLLTPGPLNETYFEHAYLARYLGFTLVEGADLTVRDSRVFIKTLEGLRQVDVILRRLDDSFCDPLELRSDSALGVAGLVEAVRAGHVTMANALGSGLVEAPGMAAFLPGLCRHLLGEELLLVAGAIVVVRASRRSAVRTGAPRRARHQTVVPAGRAPAGVWPHAQRRTEKSAAQFAAGAARGVRGAVGSGALDRAGVERHRLRGASIGPARLRGVDRRFDRGHARWTDAGRRGQQHSDRHDAAGRRKQGHLGRLGRTGQRDLAARADAAQRAARASRCRAAQPRRRQPVLARPAHRTGGADRRGCCAAWSPTSRAKTCPRMCRRSWRCCMCSPTWN